MIVCVHLPRFELAVAAGERAQVVRRSLAGAALAVAPPMGGDRSQIGQRVGEVSGAAEARGVAAGMALGEALARCPELALVPGDPVRVAEAWETAVRRLESIGAAVETGRPGIAFFATDGLHAIHGTSQATIAAARRALGRPARIGAAPTRFCALGAALATRSRRALVLDAARAPRWLAGQPVELLGFRDRTAPLVAPLRQLGVRTLGELVRLGRPALADRFGAPGAFAHGLACGQDSPLHPRRAAERLQESMEVGDASCGEALKRVLGVLVSRLLARSERRGRALRAATLSARLVCGGGWRERVVFRQALADPERIWLALSVRLLRLPAPAAVLALAVDGFGPPLGEQVALLDEVHVRSPDAVAGDRRRSRLADAVAQMRAIAGRDAALRAVCVDPDSRVPERRVVLAPVSE
jgi:protein ImuB